MIRLAVSVEGQTEEEFVKRFLDPHLRQFGVEATPTLLGHARNQRAGGGDVTVPGIVSELVRLSHSSGAITTLVDFYGFRGKGELSADDLEQAIRAGVEEAAGEQRDRLVPYVQRHEFEGLLFSDVSAFEVLPDIPRQAVRSLGAIRSAFATPEDINDSAQTAPSKRIVRAVPRFQKRVHGPLIAEEAGMERIRAECPRFNAWLKCLETLQDRIGP